MDILLMVSGKVSRSLFHQPSGSKEPGVFVLVGNMPPLNVNFSHLGETSVSAKQLIVVCIDEDEDGKEWQDDWVKGHVLILSCENTKISNSKRTIPKEVHLLLQKF